jgi:hypothetical protein
MTTMKKFVNSVTSIFQSEVEREQRALAELERQRQAREARQIIVGQAAALSDRVTEAEAQCLAKCADVDRLVKFSFEELYQGFIAGTVSIETVAERLAGREAVARHAEKIKKQAHKYFVTTAENRLAAFKKEHADELKGIELTATEEPQFIAAELAADHFVSGASARLAAAAMVATK